MERHAKIFPKLKLQNQKTFLADSDDHHLIFSRPLTAKMFCKVSNIGIIFSANREVKDRKQILICDTSIFKK